ncbi:uncharacterized protein BJX67DRAFT_339880 [Aspergillus lucknowensis]|uniref:Uncharacterized protein n=1 Tax=Aspergillus lucknowensis TaxID=176173 RepID=A0ABR4M7L3_9EURO
MLWRSTSSYMPGHNLVPVTLFPEALFYGSSLISRVYQGRLPPTLAPTQPQMSLIHATWINILPFPRMRENLIQWENSFSHSEFIADLVGDLVDTRRFFSSPASQVPNEVPQSTVVLQAADDEVTSNRNGLIIWGEPERAESWEATPGFLRKWMWVVEGCKELIESTNRWRRVRGEEPIVLSTH